MAETYGLSIAGAPVMPGASQDMRENWSRSRQTSFWPRAVGPYGSLTDICASVSKLAPWTPNPRAIVSNTIGPICALALLDHVEALNYGRAHRRIPMGSKDGGLELVGCLEVVDDGNRPKAHDPNLYALCCQRVSDELFLEECEAGIEL
jgi:hypothetical protein